MQLSDLTERVSAWLPHLLGVLPVVLAIMVGTYLLNLLVGRALIVLANRTRLTEMDVLPFQPVLRWVMRFLACILILSVLGFEIGGIWAMLSTILGLVAIGFVAVWSIVSHTSATMPILFLHPFQMGDDLEFPGEPVRGRAVDLNFFFTTLIDHDGALHQIPNNLFFKRHSSAGKTRPSSASPPSSTRRCRYRWTCPPSPMPRPTARSRNRTQ